MTSLEVVGYLIFSRRVAAITSSCESAVVHERVEQPLTLQRRHAQTRYLSKLSVKPLRKGIAKGEIAPLWTRFHNWGRRTHPLVLAGTAKIHFAGSVSVDDLRVSNEIHPAAVWAVRPTGRETKGITLVFFGRCCHWRH
jgi:hypothetical protein